MKELDLTKATVLKWLLKHGGGYASYEINDCWKDICTLTRMVIYSLGLGAVLLFSLIVTILFMIVLFCGAVWLVGLMFSFLTLYLPNGWQFVSPDDMMFGLMLLGIVCIMLVLFGIKETLEGNMDFAPEYMKRPLRKLFRKGNTGTKYNATPVKEPSPTMTAIKEMWKSFKNKTCIKVKL